MLVLLADLRGGIQCVVSGLGRGISGPETNVSAHQALVVRKLVTLRCFPEEGKLTAVLIPCVTW